MDLKSKLDLIMHRLEHGRKNHFTEREAQVSINHKKRTLIEAVLTSKKRHQLSLQILKLKLRKKGKIINYTKIMSLTKIKNTIII